ncbi:hypothetical protein TrRE_jg4924 [Triparma retinervis]|uniref:Uncharacterized protein n=1 Tax=Triparma retinervis TaxID=2557542 RepID=A0A9W7CM65_9STRA|nr:hypothetical protein TrRE_jg4924 [Triparma retinervis]
MKSPMEAPREAPREAPMKVLHSKSEEVVDQVVDQVVEEEEEEDLDSVHDDHHDDDGRVVRGSEVGGIGEEERAKSPPPTNSFVKSPSMGRLHGDDSSKNDSSIVNKGKGRDLTNLLTGAYERFKRSHRGNDEVGGAEKGRMDTTGMVKGLLHEDGDYLHRERMALEETFPEQKSMYRTLNKQFDADFNTVYSNFTMVLHPSKDAAILGSMVAANHIESKVVVICNGGREELDECAKNSTRGEHGNVLVGLSDVNRVAKYLEEVGEVGEKGFASYQVFGDLGRVCKRLLPYECENEIGR